MRTALNIDENLIARARRVSGIKGKAALVRAALEALIQREAAPRLARLGGRGPAVRSIPRRRTKEH